MGHNFSCDVSVSLREDFITLTAAYNVSKLQEASKRTFQ